MLHIFYNNDKVISFILLLQRFFLINYGNKEIFNKTTQTTS